MHKGCWGKSPAEFSLAAGSGGAVVTEFLQLPLPWCHPEEEWAMNPLDAAVHVLGHLSGAV